MRRLIRDVVIGIGVLLSVAIGVGVVAGVLLVVRSLV